MITVHRLAFIAALALVPACSSGAMETDPTLQDNGDDLTNAAAADLTAKSNQVAADADALTKKLATAKTECENLDKSIKALDAAFEKSRPEIAGLRRLKSSLPLEIQIQKDLKRANDVELTKIKDRIKEIDGVLNGTTGSKATEEQKALVAKLKAEKTTLDNELAALKAKPVADLTLAEMNERNKGYPTLTSKINAKQAEITAAEARLGQLQAQDTASANAMQAERTRLVAAQADREAQSAKFDATIKEKEDLLKAVNDDLDVLLRARALSNTQLPVACIQIMQ